MLVTVQASQGTLAIGCISVDHMFNFGRFQLKSQEVAKKPPSPICVLNLS